MAKKKSSKSFGSKTMRQMQEAVNKIHHPGEHAAAFKEMLADDVGWMDHDGIADWVYRLVWRAPGHEHLPTQGNMDDILNVQEAHFDPESENGGLAIFPIMMLSGRLPSGGMGIVAVYAPELSNFEVSEECTIIGRAKDFLQHQGCIFGWPKNPKTSDGVEVAEITRDGGLFYITPNGLLGALFVRDNDVGDIDVFLDGEWTHLDGLGDLIDSWFE